jgi:ribosomal-protein-alanine N-acetyltransferase
LIVVPALIEDLPGLLAIESASFVQPWSEADFLSELRKFPMSLYIIRRDSEGPVLGYVCFWTAADEFQLFNLAVHPDHRRQGLGRRLLTFLLIQAREKRIPKVFLEVRASNLAAIALYGALGFKTLYRRPGYYAPSGEDALVMEWSG